jgi:hypothetical protein
MARTPLVQQAELRAENLIFLKKPDWRVSLGESFKTECVAGVNSLASTFRPRLSSETFPQNSSKN